MSIEIKVPTLPESVTDATVAKWYKQVGDTIERDENLVDLETDKVMLEVPAPKSGVLTKVNVEEGAIVTAGQVLAMIDESGAAATAEPAAKPAEAQPADTKSADAATDVPPASTAAVSGGPAARRAAREEGLDAAHIAGSGKGGRVTKDDVEKAKGAEPASTPPAAKASTTAATSQPVATGAREEERVPMSRLRQRIAERLVQVQSEAAILTSFNEIDMKPVMDLRKKYKEQFEKEQGTRLGFMSFFTKAVVEALKRFPSVNASIDGKDVIYHNYYDIGIAIGSPRGLVVPIVRDADLLSMADIEKNIRAYAGKAKDGKLTIEDMQGGTFTITNGGTYGSMMSTPIINPPQSAILGMHNIVERPVVVNGEIVIRPMMYVALSYDHRIIDGKESVTFLRTVKELLEDPARMLLQI